jgi:hypothetical protein
MQFFLPQPPQQPGPFKAALNAFIAEELVLTGSLLLVDIEAKSSPGKQLLKQPS